MAKLVSQFIDRARTAARAIKAQAEASGEKISLSQSYERFAKTNGYRTWNAMRSSMESVERVIDTANSLNTPVTSDLPRFLLYYSLSPVAIWAFTKEPDDVTLRTMVYDDLDHKAARYGLAKMFPKGTAASEIERRLDASDRSDAKESVLRRLADDVIKFVRDAAVWELVGGNPLYTSETPTIR